MQKERRYSMGQKYVYNPLTCEYDIIDEGAPGLPGPRGPIGAPGVGVPSGGTTGQVLSKTSDDDHDTEWTNPGGGALDLQSVLDTGNEAHNSLRLYDEIDPSTLTHLDMYQLVIEGDERTSWMNTNNLRLGDSLSGYSSPVETADIDADQQKLEFSRSGYG